ncbi:MAG: CoA-binding protein [Deltaproteobacteria bacterium]|nr:CoA-binding protein [Deltaproteobacteria bacterium]
METAGRSIFDTIFDPRAVAIIGASPSDQATLSQMKTKIRERLYLVNPKYTEVLGKKCYPSILDVEAEIDYVIIGISAALLPQVLEQCIQKGVKVAQLFTAGFSETGIPERVKQEEDLKKLAKGRIRLLGPNCFGVYCLKTGLSIIPESPTEEGHIGVVAQSGSFVESFSYFAETKNLRFSKMVSYGNAADLDGADFLEYLADDADTKLIAFYIEGTRNAPHLSAALTRAARQKPVIAIKGGMTDQGMRAAASHTAALAGSPDIWRAFFKQCGALQVDNFDEMVNTLIAFDTSPLPSGRAMALITNSGGFSVIQTDLCLRARGAPVFSGDHRGPARPGSRGRNRHRESSGCLAHLLQCRADGKHRRHHHDRRRRPTDPYPGFPVRSVPLFTAHPGTGDRRPHGAAHRADGRRLRTGP